MNIPQDYRVLVSRLVQLTNEGRAKWYEYQDGVALWLAGFGVHIWGGENEGGISFVGLGLIRKSDPERIFDSFSLMEGSPDYIVLVNLFGQARRQARGVGNAINRLVEEIENTSGKVGESPELPF